MQFRKHYKLRVNLLAFEVQTKLVICTLLVANTLEFRTEMEINELNSWDRWLGIHQIIITTQKRLPLIVLVTQTPLTALERFFIRWHPKRFSLLLAQRTLRKKGGNTRHGTHSSCVVYCTDFGNHKTTFCKTQGCLISLWDRLLLLPWPAVLLPVICTQIRQKYKTLATRPRQS